MSPYRHALTEIERSYRGREIARVRVRMPYVDSWSAVDRLPNQNPCAKGHIGITNRNGWIVCAACGAVIAKAGK